MAQKLQLEYVHGKESGINNQLLSKHIKMDQEEGIRRFDEQTHQKGPRSLLKGNQRNRFSTHWEHEHGANVDITLVEGVDS